MAGRFAYPFGLTALSRVADAIVESAAIAEGPYGRDGGRGVRLSGDADAEVIFEPLDVPADATAIVEVDLRLSAYPASATAFLRIYDGATVQVELRLNTNGTLEAYSNGSSLGSASTFAAPLTRHFRVGLKALVHASAGTVDVQVFDAGDTTAQAVLALTGLDTQVSGTAQWTRLSIKAAGTGTTDYGNLVVKDGSGGVNDDFATIPEAVSVLLPNATGSNSQFQRSSGLQQFATVDDAFADDDVTYNRALTENKTDTLHYQDPPFPDHRMAFVMLMLVAKGVAATTERLAHVERQDDGTLLEGDVLTPTGSYLAYLRAYDTMPDGQAFAPDTESDELANDKALEFAPYQYGYAWPVEAT
jgi:hypothetical protein